MNMTTMKTEELQKIVDDAPEGVTHYDAAYRDYLDVAVDEEFLLDYGITFKLSDIRAELESRQFKVGDRVVILRESKTIDERCVHAIDDIDSRHALIGCEWIHLKNLRHATPEEEAAGYRIDEPPKQMLTRESLLPPLRTEPVTFLNDAQLSELTKDIDFSAVAHVRLKHQPDTITTQLDPAKCGTVDPTGYDAMSESHRSPAYHCHELPLDADLKAPVVASHPHYFKDVSGFTHIDVYQVLRLYEVTDPCLQHIVKKALCAGKRGSKDYAKDVREIADTANRLVEIEAEQGE